MKLMYWALLLVGVGIVYVMVNRPTVPTGVTAPSASNDIFSSLFKLGATAIGKIGTPSASPYVNAGTYNVNPSEISGNTLVDTTTGQTLTYGTD